MQKIFVNINGEVDNDMLNSFIRLHEQSHGVYKDMQIICYFQSNGGSASISECIVDIINNIPNFTLVAQGEISSGAFIIFFLSKCNKRVASVCTGMCHLGGFSTTINHTYKKGLYGNQIAMLDDMKVGEKKMVKFFKKIGMKKEDRERYMRDCDVSYSARQLKIFIKNQKKIGYIP